MLVDNRNGSFVIAGLVALCLSLANNAWSQQSWQPEGTVEITVPNAPGGTIDRVARHIQKVLQDHKLVSVPVIVMNRPGGNQTVAGAYVRRFPGNPHKLLYMAPTLLPNQITGLTEQRYTDLTPLALIAIEYASVTVKADSPIKNTQDLISRLKADPESVVFGTTGRGGPNDLVLAQAVKAAGIDPKRLRVVSFKNNPEALTAVIAGHVHAATTSAAAAFPWQDRGQARLLFISAQKRQVGELAGVPTLREQGINVSQVDNFRGVYGPTGLTAAQIAFWEEALATVVESDEWKKHYGENQDFLRSKDFAGYLKRQYESYREVLTDLGLAK